MTLTHRESEGQPLSLRLLSRLAAVAALLAVATAVASLLYLGSTVQKEIDQLGLSNSDRSEWSMGQVEVDLLKLVIAAQAASASMTGDAAGTTAGEAELRRLRRRFDIFYSRVQTMRESRQYTFVRDQPEAVDALQRIGRFLERYVPAIDGSDAALSLALPRMLSDLDGVTEQARRFSVSGVGYFAESSDMRRDNVAQLMTRIAALTLGLVLILLLVAMILFSMLRRTARSEAAVGEARNRLQEVVASSIDGIVVIDLDGKVIEYNGAAEGIFGYTRDEALGQPLDQLIIPHGMRKAHNDGMARYRRTGERRIVGQKLLKLDAMRKDGSLFPVEFTVVSAQLDRKEIFVAFLRDISDRVAAERELIEARDTAVASEKKKAELLAVMSHEMRTPLNGLIGTLELCADDEMSAKQRRYFGAMQTSANLLLHHVNDVLNISKAESGQLDLKTEAIDPRALLRELVESQRRSIEANGNRIHLNADDGPDRIWGDPLRLRQIILNLVGNANKFSRNGDIVVEYDRMMSGDMVEFRVLDTGIGIAAEDHERIFEDFRTLDASYGRTAHGTGLGLGIARRLAHAMGGSIGVESEVGEGSLFWVRLPIGKRPAHYSSGDDVIEGRATEVADPVEALDILLVEDNEINRLVARDMLARDGHRVEEAHDGREGVGMAARRRYDIILMDISMPEMDGTEATQAIRLGDGPNRDTPIIALTAHALSEDIERFKAAGINDVMAKPLSMKGLHRILRENRSAPERTGETAAPMTDLGVLSDLAGQLGDEKARDLLGRFIAEAEETLTALPETCPADPDARKDVAGRVHKLAGSATVFGASGLGARLRELENLLRGSDEFDYPAARGALGRAWTETRADLDTWSATATA